MLTKKEKIGVHGRGASDRRSSGPMDLRAAAILRAVIEEYVTTATPVGARRSSTATGWASSATVRNILAELELAGLLDHPHTRPVASRPTPATAGTSKP